jgi:hypothetical protein
MKILVAVIVTCILSLLGPVVLMAQAGPESGTVAEAINAGSYVYLRLEEPDRWIATTPLEVSEGDQVEYAGGMEMRDFRSKALDRSFESIWFVQNVSVTGRDLEKLHQGVEESRGSAPPIPKPATVAAPSTGEFEKLEGGLTIAEIQADPAALSERAVSLRARVIKVNENIMGKNWITLQDGTGAAPNDKLLATSQEKATLGETVTVQGVVRTDVDLGSGYRYDVLLEEATFIHQ